MEKELCNECKNLAYGKYLANMAKEQGNTYFNLNLNLYSVTIYIGMKLICLQLLSVSVQLGQGLQWLRGFRFVFFCLGFWGKKNLQPKGTTSAVVVQKYKIHKMISITISGIKRTLWEFKRKAVKINFLGLSRPKVPLPVKQEGTGKILEF